MKAPLYLARLVITGVMVLAFAGSAAAADRKTSNTLLGAGLGAAAGAVLSQGDLLSTLGAAAAGGVLGNLLTEDRSHGDWNRGRQYKHVERRHVERRPVQQRYNHDKGRHNSGYRR